MTSPNANFTQNIIKLTHEHHYFFRLSLVPSNLLCCCCCLSFNFMLTFSLFSLFSFFVYFVSAPRVNNNYTHTISIVSTMCASGDAIRVVLRVSLVSRAKSSESSNPLGTLRNPIFRRATKIFRANRASSGWRRHDGTYAYISMGTTQSFLTAFKPNYHLQLTPTKPPISLLHNAHIVNESCFSHIITHTHYSKHIYS